MRKSVKIVKNKTKQKRAGGGGIVKDQNCDCKIQKTVSASEIQRWREKVGNAVRMYKLDQFLSCDVRIVKNMKRHQI